MSAWTEEQIERRIEKQTDRLDHQFMSGLLTQQQYDSSIAAMRKWEEGARFANKRGTDA